MTCLRSLLSLPIGNTCAWAGPSTATDEADEGLPAGEQALELYECVVWASGECLVQRLHALED